MIPISDIVVKFLQGAAGGFAIGFAGFLKQQDPGKSSFDGWKIAPIVLTAGVVGGVAGVLGQDYGVVETSSIGAGIGLFVLYAVKAARRKYSVWKASKAVR